MKDLAGLMKQAQDMQKRMAEAQARLEEVEVVGQAGAGMVELTMSAKGELRGVKIDPSLLSPDDGEVLEDLIKAAHADAKRKADQAQQEHMSQITRDLPIPPGFDMPFGVGR